MSVRFIAHVERPDGRVHHVDCDAAHENDAGRLSLTVNTYIGAIAAYAPGEWASYYLEAAPEPVTREQVERGEKSINDYRRSLGMPAFNIACAVVHRDHDGNAIPCPCFDCGGSRACPACEGHGHRDGERCRTCESLGSCPTCRDR